MNRKLFLRNILLLRLIIPLLAILIITSCNKDPVREHVITDNTTPVSYKSGIFVINEGNFNWGNASVSFIDKKTDSVFSDIYRKMNNNVSLGDVAQEMKINGTSGYIVINNSNKIEVVNLDNFKSIKTINGLNSPRSIEFINAKKGYVTNLLGEISVVDLNSMTVTKSIPTANWTEKMIMYNKYMYVSAVGKFSDPNSERHAKILVIDTERDMIIDSIKSGKEPLGMVIDRKQKVWVLCTGGFDNFEPPSLLRINPELRTVEKSFSFPGVSETPSRLCINGTGDTLYFLKNGIYKMPVSALEVPSAPFIPSDGRLFYGLDIDPSSGNIYATDAVDYVQDGWVFRFNQKNGALIENYKAGRIPASFCFPASQKRK